MWNPLPLQISGTNHSLPRTPLKLFPLQSIGLKTHWGGRLSPNPTKTYSESLHGWLRVFCLVATCCNKIVPLTAKTTLDVLLCIIVYLLARCYSYLPILFYADSDKPFMAWTSAGYVKVGLQLVLWNYRSWPVQLAVDVERCQKFLHVSLKGQDRYLHRTHVQSRPWDNDCRIRFKEWAKGQQHVCGVRIYMILTGNRIFCAAVR